MQKEEYKNRETFVRRSGSAMVSLIGVNDQLDFTDITKCANLIRLSRECNYFCTRINKYKCEIDSLTSDFEKDRKRIRELEEEIKFCTSCAVTWESEFIEEIKKLSTKNDIDKLIRYALWELEQLSIISAKTFEALKVTYQHYLDSKEYIKD